MTASSEKPTCLLRFPKVKERTGYSHSAIYALIALGKFPAPIKIGARAVAWVESEVQAWIGDRVKASRNGSGEVAR